MGLFCIDDGSLFTQVGDRWMVLDLRLAHKEGELLSLVQMLKSHTHTLTHTLTHTHTHTLTHTFAASS